MKARTLSVDEARAWARVAATVKPIGPPAADLDAFAQALESGVEEAAAAPPARPKAEKKADPAKTPAPPAERSGEKKVRRGKLAIAGTIDLHGHTQASAARALPAYLEAQQAEGARCVLVITGKGRLGEGVLKRNFLDWLDTAAARKLVSGFAESHPRHGGAGAFYVFLRKPR